MIKTKVAFLEGRLLSSQSRQYEKFSKSPDWLEKSRSSKKPILFWLCKQANTTPTVNQNYSLKPMKLNCKI